MAVGVLMFLFALLLVAGLPVGAVLGSISILPNLADSWFPADAQYIIRSMINGVNSFPILAVPMFILSGNIMARGKISENFCFFAFLFSKQQDSLAVICLVCFWSYFRLWLPLRSRSYAFLWQSGL